MLAVLPHGSQLLSATCLWMQRWTALLVGMWSKIGNNSSRPVRGRWTHYWIPRLPNSKNSCKNKAGLTVNKSSNLRNPSGQKTDNVGTALRPHKDLRLTCSQQTFVRKFMSYGVTSPGHRRLHHSARIILHTKSAFSKYSKQFIVKSSEQQQSTMHQTPSLPPKQKEIKHNENVTTSHSPQHQCASSHLSTTTDQTMGFLHRSPTHPIPSTRVFNPEASAPTATKTRTFSH